MSSYGAVRFSGTGRGKWLEGKERKSEKGGERDFGRGAEKVRRCGGFGQAGLGRSRFRLRVEGRMHLGLLEVTGRAMAVIEGAVREAELYARECPTTKCGRGQDAVSG